MRDQQKERLWRIRKELMDLVNEAANLLGQGPLDLAAKSDGDSDRLKCKVSVERGDGINRTLKFEQVWQGKDEDQHFLNVGVMIHTTQSGRK